MTLPLAQFLDALGLGKGGRVLGILHSLQKIPLFGSRQIGQLHSGIEGDFLLVYQVQQFGDEVGQADIALNLLSAFSGIVSASRNGVLAKPSLPVRKSFHGVAVYF